MNLLLTILYALLACAFLVFIYFGVWALFLAASTEPVSDLTPDEYEVKRERVAGGGKWDAKAETFNDSTWTIWRNARREE